jgi:multicomponent K+:H+ antiporter subunit F
LLIVLWDIVVANVQVALIILFKREADIRSHWIPVPLDLTSAEAITVLAGTITMTPGTVSATPCRRWQRDPRALPAHRRSRQRPRRHQVPLRTPPAGDLPMIEYALFFAAGCYGLALLLDLWRIAVGPDAADRILALDTMVINVIALLVLYGVWRGTAIYFEPAMLIAMVGFVSTVAYCRFLLRGDIIE